MEKIFKEIRKILSIHLSESQANEAAHEITAILEQPKSELLKNIEENKNDKFDPKIYLRDWDSMISQYERILQQSSTDELKLINSTKLSMLNRFRSVILGMSRELELLYNIKQGLEIALGEISA